MIKINVITNNNNWYKSIKNPVIYINRKINKKHSGLVKSRDILKSLEEIKVIEFDHNDVVRHPLVSKIIKAYQNKSIDDKI